MALQREKEHYFLEFQKEGFNFASLMPCGLWEYVNHGVHTRGKKYDLDRQVFVKHVKMLPGKDVYPFTDYFILQAAPVNQLPRAPNGWRDPAIPAK